MTKTQIETMIDELKEWYQETFTSAKDMKPWELRQAVINMGIREIHAQMEVEVQYNQMMEESRKLYETMDAIREEQNDS